MKKNYLKILSAGLLLIAVSAWFSANSFADSTGHGKGVGSPDENTCSQSGCHGKGGGNGIPGGLDNSGPGSISIACSNMPGWVYTPGTVYHMTVTINQTACTLFGFSCIGLDEGLAQAGSITITDNVHTKTAGSYPINKQYITHGGHASTAPLTATTTNPANFSFDWTAPATNKGPLTFYFDGLAANNDSLEDGNDNVYKGSQVITPNAALTTATVYSDITAFNLRTTTGSVSQGMPFYVGGHALTGNITVTAPTPFEVATAPGGPYSATVNLTQFGGNVMATRVWVRYNSALSGSTSGTITVSSTGATNKTATMTGQLASPSISTPVPSTITQFTTTVGTPSICDSFTVSFNSMIDTFHITAPANFEISHHTNRSFVPSDWTVGFPPLYAFTNMKFYVRYNPTVAGMHSGNVIISSLGCANKTVAVSGISTAVSLSKYSLSESDLKLFPNPAKEATHLAFNLALAKQLEFRIIDITGKQYYSTGKKTFKKGDNELVFPIENLAQGLYYITAEDKGQTIHKAFIKQ